MHDGYANLQNYAFDLRLLGNVTLKARTFFSDVLCPYAERFDVENGRKRNQRMEISSVNYPQLSFQKKMVHAYTG